MDEMSFEQALKKLEEIVSKLENGNIPLDESFKLYEEGLKLSSFVEEKLKNIEKKITILVKENGEEEEVEIEK